MTTLFGGRDKPSTVAERPVERMPDENDPRVLKARQEQARLAQMRSGRASTLLSGEGDYGSDKLGTA